jgi:hypothetical protein
MVDNKQQIENLLHHLNEWRRAARFDPSGNSESNIASTGESNAIMNDIMSKLDNLGAHYYWREDIGMYCLDESKI